LTTAESTYIPADEYREYVRLRALNRALTSAAVWAGCWMIAGSAFMVAGYLLRPYPEVVGVDPAGRGWELRIVDQNGHAVKKGSHGE
jgi:hypothetical protein